MENFVEIENIVYENLVKYRESLENAKILKNEIKAIKKENKAIRTLFDRDDESLDRFLAENYKNVDTQLKNHLAAPSNIFSLVPEQDSCLYDLDKMEITLEQMDSGQAT